mmetsp:Transcript_31209/g.94418  ORF Transcript_31209/g.94418 Transcript_31209/m.94418 type:complete len:313 (-) Transcript_31209:361-1299(-)
MGPKPKAKLNTKKKTLTAIAHPAEASVTSHLPSSPGMAGLGGTCVTYIRPMMPITTQERVIPMELQSISCRRPARSASTTAGNVERKLTKFVIVVNLFLLNPIEEKIFGPKYMNAFMPTSCCKSCNVMPRMRRRATRPWHNSVHAGSPSCLDFSISWKISSSSATASSSARIDSSTFNASLRLPFDTSHLGDRGRKIMPMMSMTAGMQMMPMTTRQPSSRSTRSWSMKAASKMPKVMPSWYKVESAPRRLAGANSLWYNTMTLESSPMDIPATNRPTSSWADVQAAACTTEPMMKTMLPTMMDTLRPKDSRK